MLVVGLRWQPAGDDREVVGWSGKDCDNGSVVGGWSGTRGDDVDGLEMVMNVAAGKSRQKDERRRSAYK
nr:hypothetical protein [Tanacetum cinerariifolium]GEX29291.1 hypothetical protein [Tanacetum cinerariifolium]